MEKIEVFPDPPVLFETCHYLEVTCIIIIHNRLNFSKLDASHYMIAHRSQLDFNANVGSDHRIASSGFASRFRALLLVPRYGMHRVPHMRLTHSLTGHKRDVCMSNIALRTPWAKWWWLLSHVSDRYSWIDDRPCERVCVCGGGWLAQCVILAPLPVVVTWTCTHYHQWNELIIVTGDFGKHLPCWSLTKISITR